MEPVEDILDIGVLVEIDRRERVAVAGQELLDPERLGRVARADENDIAEAVRDHLDSPEDERAHHDLTQLAVRLHELEQMVAFDLDHLAGLRGADLDEAAASRQDTDLAIELSRPEHDDHLGLTRLVAGGADDVRGPDHRQLAIGHDEEPGGLFTGVNEHLVFPDPASLAMLGDALDLRVVQRGVEGV